MHTLSSLELAQNIKQWGQELGFANVGITHTDLSEHEASYFNWIGENFHGEMEYMATHGTKRTRPQELVPGTLSIVSVKMNYFSDNPSDTLTELKNSEKAYISRYALGKDYHKLLRKRLQQLANKIIDAAPETQYRAFVDSAPVLETTLARNAGLGFKGKHSLLIDPKAGSWFFLGELYLSIELPTDLPVEKQGCGPCTACIQECPTQAILPGNQIDARRCVSYLTIESSAPIPVELRTLMGNRIYGCDDCQLVCPWNKFMDATTEIGFSNQYKLKDVDLLELWQWDETKFLSHFEGSPIRRIGYEKWLRNLAVAIGNLQGDSELLHSAIAQLSAKEGISDLVKEHVDWACMQLQSRESTTVPSQSNPKPKVAKRYFLGKNKLYNKSKIDP